MQNGVWTSTPSFFSDLTLRQVLYPPMWAWCSTRSKTKQVRYWRHRDWRHSIISVVACPDRETDLYRLAPRAIRMNRRGDPYRTAHTGVCPGTNTGVRRGETPPLNVGHGSTLYLRQNNSVVCLYNDERGYTYQNSKLLDTLLKRAHAISYRRWWYLHVSGVVLLHARSCQFFTLYYFILSTVFAFTLIYFNSMFKFFPRRRSATKAHCINISTDIHVPFCVQDYVQVFVFMR